MQGTDFLTTAIFERRSLDYATYVRLMDLTWSVVPFLETLHCLIVVVTRLREAANQVLRSPILDSVLQIHQFLFFGDARAVMN